MLVNRQFLGGAHEGQPGFALFLPLKIGWLLNASSNKVANHMFLLLLIESASEGLQIFDQRTFVVVREICTEIVAFVLDKVGTFVCCDELGD
jgi:hypothetical protein